MLGHHPKFNIGDDIEVSKPSSFYHGKKGRITEVKTQNPKWVFYWVIFELHEGTSTQIFAEYELWRNENAS